MWKELCIKGMFTGVFFPFPPLVSPRFFFRCEFFSRALLSERLEQATSAPTVDDAKETRKQLTELGDLAGFHMRKWISNEPDVIADIVEGDRASDIDLEKRELPTTKTLGVLWAATDYFFPFETHYS